MRHKIQIFPLIILVCCSYCSKPQEVPIDKFDKPLKAYQQDNFVVSWYSFNYFGSDGKLHDIRSETDIVKFKNKFRYISDIQSDDGIQTIYCGRGKLSLILDTTQALPFITVAYNENFQIIDSDQYQGYPLYIVNRHLLNRFTVSSGDGYGIILEAKDVDGKWKPINCLFQLNGYQSSWDYTLSPGEYLIASVPKHFGSYETELRVKLKTHCMNFYSNAFKGKISKSQFLIPDSILTNKHKYITFSY